jgi:hypothetical protein
VLQCREIDGETRAMLPWIGARMTQAGRVSVTRRDLADVFDIDERRIR